LKIPNRLISVRPGKSDGWLGELYVYNNAARPDWLIEMKFNYNDD
jgi:hypothetical protein